MGYIAASETGSFLDASRGPVDFKSLQTLETAALEIDPGGDGKKTSHFFYYSYIGRTAIAHKIRDDGNRSPDYTQTIWHLVQTQPRYLERWILLRTLD